MRKLFVLSLVLLFVGGIAADAANLKKGDKELNFRFSYSNISPDTGSDLKTTELQGAFGYLFTDAQEVGGSLAYMKQEVGSVSTDSSEFGVFYNYNFRAGEMMNPYLGANVSTIGGDLGDVYDKTFGIEGGLKVYPWSNGGFLFGVRWDKLTGANDAIGDATNTAVFGGVLIKF